MPTKIYDIHPHIISNDDKKYPITPLGGKRSVWSAERPVTFEKMIAEMDKAGVTKAAIVHSSTTYGYDNSYAIDCAATNPKRFTVVFSVDVLAPDASEKIRYWKSKGGSGIRIFTAGSTFDKQSDTVADPRSFPAWRTCTELGMTVCVQLRPEGTPQLLTLIKEFPNTRILVDHLLKAPAEDGPPYAAAQYVWDLARFPNVYMKLSTNNVRGAKKGKGTPETYFARFVKEFGANRIGWGSNYPASTGTLPEMVNEAKEALSSLKSEDQEWIFWKTAEVLYPELK